jgi:outer membrane protein assembly factor BamB
VRCVIPLLYLLVSVSVAAEDWPEFRGPTGQGHSTETGLPLEWSSTRNIAWKVPVEGTGWSSPVVAGGRVWLTSARESGREVSMRALAFDAETGKRLVDTEVFRTDTTTPVHQKNSRASPTPIVSGDRVYVHFGPDGTAALDTTGRVLWRRTLPYEPQHGNGGSPALYRDLLIINCDGNGPDSYVVALDTNTGRPRWRRDRPAPAAQAYTTPLIVRVGTRDLAISVGAFRTIAYDPATGDEVWRVRYADGFSNVPRPVFAHGLVVINTGFNAPSFIAVRADGHGDVTKTHVAWTVSRGVPFISSPIVVGTQLYYVSDTGVLSSLEARSGTMLWQARLGGNYAASPVAADGRIYFQSEEGVTTVIAPGPAFDRLAVNSLDEPTLASIAVSGGALYIRGERNLYKISESVSRRPGLQPRRNSEP